MYWQHLPAHQLVVQKGKANSLISSRMEEERAQSLEQHFV